MSISNIKISELNEFPVQIISEDFLPLVDSSSMTTYHASLASVLGTIPPVTNVAMATSARSASWASHSFNSDYSTRSVDTDIKGTRYYFPFWNNSGISGSLTPSSSLYVTHSNITSQGIIIVNPIVSADNSLYQPTTTPSRLDYKQYPYWHEEQQHLLNGDVTQTNGGIFSTWPIVGASFVGTDQNKWKFKSITTETTTEEQYLPSELKRSNTFWSGSSKNGGTITIGSGYNNLSQSFNGKWIRIASTSLLNAAPYEVLCENASHGEVANPNFGFFGRVRILVSTGYGYSRSNVDQPIDMHVDNQQYGGGVSAQVFEGGLSSKQIIKKIRLSVLKLKNDGDTPYDPMLSFDIFIDNIQDGDDILDISVQSWGGVRFLTTPNVQPPELVNTGSNPLELSYIVFPPQSGYYTNLGHFQDHLIQGKNVIINPTANEITNSSWYEDTSVKSPYSLHVSGTINTQNYWSNGLQGQGGLFVAYDPVTAGWYNMQMNGGILVSSGSAVAAPSVAASTDTVAVGTIIAYGGTTAPNNWLECDGSWLLIASFPDLYNAIKNTDPNSIYGYKCLSNGVRDAAGTYFKLPDLRGEFLRGWDHGRGVDVNRTVASAQSSLAGGHYHGVGTFGAISNDDGFFITNNSPFTTPTKVPLRQVAGQSQDGTQTLTSDFPFPIITTGPITSISGDSNPRNVAVIYIIKYSNAVNFANSTTTLNGDVTGNVSSTYVQGLRGIGISNTGPTDQQVLTYDGGLNLWIPKPYAVPVVTSNGPTYLDTPIEVYSISMITNELTNELTNIPNPNVYVTYDIPLLIPLSATFIIMDASLGIGFTQFGSFKIRKSSDLGVAEYTLVSWSDVSGTTTYVENNTFSGQGCFPIITTDTPAPHKTFQYMFKSKLQYPTMNANAKIRIIGYY